MAELTPSQLRFLSTQEVPLSKTFDAQGMERWLYRELMSSDDLWIAYGVSPCDLGQHTLRTRTGSCVQCGTAQLAFLKRWKGRGYIYVASSSEIVATKVGVASNPVKRIDTLNRIGYGGASDWSLFNSGPCANMGMMEHQVHTLLSAHRIPAVYIRAGHFVECKELFKKSPTAAWKVVVKVLERAA